MGNHRLYKIQCLQTLGTIESERLKVTALNLFHPTVSPPFQKVDLFYIATQSPTREGISLKEFRVWTKVLELYLKSLSLVF